MIWLMMIFFLIIPQGFAKAEDTKSVVQPAQKVVEDRYHTVLENWKNDGLGSASDFEATVHPSDFKGMDEKDLLPEAKSKGYGDRVFYWHNHNSASFEVDVKEDGLYEISFDYFPLNKEVVPIEGSIKVNGEFPYYESRRIVFPKSWENVKSKFEKDRFGNEIIPKQKAIAKWETISAEDASHLQPDALKYHLKKGMNEITLSNLRGEMLIGSIKVHSPTEVPTYKQYIKSHHDQPAVDEMITQEAEIPQSKNSSYTRPMAVQDASVKPNDAKLLLLNSFGGESWDESGQRVDWGVDIKKAGYYRLTFKVQQNKETGGPVFRKVFIDGSVPFKEVAHYTFDYTKDWSNVTLSNVKGHPYLFYFSKGKHTLSLEADASPYEEVFNTTNEVMKGIEDLSLSIKKLTGNQMDRSRDWKISEYIPDIKKRVAGWEKALEDESKYVKSLSSSKKDPREVVSLKLAAKKLRTLNEKPDEIPNRLTELSEGSSSVSQLLGTLLIDMQKQPLLIDRFYVHGGNQKVPSAEANFFSKAAFGIKRFFLSFHSGTYTASDTDDKTIQVWVNRPRQYVELIQNMADQNFTPKTGIHVKFSIMPDESKLILASAAKKQPDVALGISNWLPYELSIRGAAVDLHQFPDFEKFSKQFSPGAFLPMMVDDSVYALPETQDFFVQFYRKDILNALNIPVPDTWNDVVDILPELQRVGMNYYTPIAGAGGFKPFQTTAPFIYQFNGDLYKDGGMKTDIDSEQSLKAIKFMTDLNTIYSMPLQVPNFYDHFRYSTLPIGVSSFTTYVQLTSAAPEIAGWWGITPQPGIKQSDGSVARWATGSGQSAMIFKGTKDKKKSWELLKWWMSKETQTAFATNLQTLYGPEYMWNTANIEAFKNLPWPEEDKKVILEQWKYLKEVPKTPGAYMVERELSNIWNKVVFDGENTRSAVDDSVIAIDREISRKMEEFGYMKNGKVIKPYRVPSIEQVKSWAGEQDEK
ncbi:extracellular solute-binding protein [Falsibacillus albus]|uniref:Extracellular solute-binding protein n=1 Tax=Falsibacillus albus TaxID=2478915 RepID=A0A3L7K4C1_9BACI|nr:extracellular solute-binding protein [Falsibacillus albus]